MTKEELQERAQLVRIHEANCDIEHPTAAELNFRLAVMKKLAREFGLAELKSAVILGPNKDAPTPSPADTKPARR